MSFVLHKQAAALRWAASAMSTGRGKSCIEAAVRAATCGTLDKGVEARESGGALLTTLVQVFNPSLTQGGVQTSFYLANIEMLFM